jgi:serine phosphatase RsbU (regulator of sigma subunit)
MKRLLLLALISLCFCKGLLAQRDYIPTEKIDWLEDSTDIQGVVSKPFQAYQGQKFRRGQTYWLKVRLPNYENQTQLRFQFSLGLNAVEIFLVGSNGELLAEPIAAGFFSKLPPMERLAVPISIPAQQSVEIYARVKVFTGLDFKPEFILTQPEVYLHSESSRFFYQFLFLGAILMVLIYSLLMFFLLGKWIYLHYGLYLLSVWIIFSVFSSSIHFLLPAFPYLAIYFLHFALCLVGVFYIQFLRCFFSTRRLFKAVDQMLHRLVFLQLAVLAVEIGVLVVWFDLGLAHRINSLNNVITFGVVLFAGFYFSRVSDRSSKLIAAGNFLLIATVLAAAGKILFWQDFSVWGGLSQLYLVEFGVLGEVLLFSLGLGLKVREAENKRREAEMQALQAQKLLNQQLEDQVRIRTQQLSEANEELALTNQAINSSLFQISQQAGALEKRNQDIAASITYAKRIQEAILPQSEDLNAAFVEHFLFYQAKDIVSGDFYWVHKTADKIFVALADCTGHGVPGAFMSLLGHELLNQTIIENQIHEPEKVLDRLHLGIRKLLHQKESGNRDGMDLALAVFEPQNNRVRFAAAHQSMVYFQNGLLNECKGDMMGVGGFEMSKIREFTGHRLEVDFGQQPIFYLFSDGYKDQFGGPKGTKLGSSHFKSILQKIHHRPVDQQKELLKAIFVEWTEHGKHKQVDDILIMGIKLI